MKEIDLLRVIKNRAVAVLIGSAYEGYTDAEKALSEAIQDHHAYERLQAKRKAKKAELAQREKDFRERQVDAFAKE